VIYLDTHVAVWLYLGDLSKFSENAKRAINQYDLKISPVVVLELTYLFEIGRLRTEADIMLNFLNEAVGLEICNASFQEIVRSAVRQTWTRDPFDRLIAGHAAFQNTGLLTKDEVIRRNYLLSVW